MFVDDWADSLVVFLKIQYDLAEKKIIPDGVGYGLWGWVWGLIGVYCKFKDRFKPTKNQNSNKHIFIIIQLGDLKS